MEAPELAVKIGPPVTNRRDEKVTNRRGPDRPFSNLSPVDSVVRKLTIPGAFSPQEQVLVLKAHGLSETEIGGKIGLSRDIVSYKIRTARRDFGSNIGAITSLVDTGKISISLLTEGLDFGKYVELTPRQKDVLDVLSRQDMWGVEDSKIASELGLLPHTVQDYLHHVYSVIGVTDRTQAIIYRLYMMPPRPEKPLSLEEQREAIRERRLKVVTLKAQGLTEAEIADELHTTARIVKYDIESVKTGYSSLTDAVISRLEDGTIRLEDVTINQSAVAKKFVPGYYSGLTRREKDMLSKLLASRDAEGNKGIADSFGLVEQTVKNHFGYIFEKLDVRDRVQAAVFEYIRIRGKPRAISRRQMSLSGIR